MGGGLTPEHYRLFVAINLPERVRSEIANAQDELRRALPDAAVRWTKAEQFHLTLRFLGNVQAGQVDSLITSLRLVCHVALSLELEAKGIGFFPNAKRPRVIWVGISDSENRLVRVQEAVQQATLKFTEQEPEQSFSGHITLGRIKNLGPRDTQLLATTRERFSSTIFGKWTAHELYVLRSQLSSQGAEHAVMAEVPFLH